MEILNLLSNVLERNLFYFENLIFSKIKFRFSKTSNNTYEYRLYQYIG